MDSVSQGDGVKACTDRYSKRIELQRLNGTADAAGHVDNTADANWDHYVSAYARVQTRGGREFWKVQQVTADVSHVWTCPYGSRLAAATPDMRLRYQGSTYQILSVVDIDEAHETVEIQTRKAV